LRGIPATERVAAHLREPKAEFIAGGTVGPAKWGWGDWSKKGHFVASLVVNFVGL
jgi:hypothetical protein